MNIGEYKQLAKLIRDNETYKVYDLTQLEQLNVSLTELYPQKSTGGHAHEKSDEVYFFTEGVGTIEIGEEKLKVKAGDVFTVPGGKFHKVYNEGDTNLSFWTVFEKYEGRGK